MCIDVHRNDSRLCILGKEGQLSELRAGWELIARRIGFRTPQRQVRGRWTVRDARVRTRNRYISVIRARLRQHG